jgi:hypothetical protein
MEHADFWILLFPLDSVSVQRECHAMAGWGLSSLAAAPQHSLLAARDEYRSIKGH